MSAISHRPTSPTQRLLAIYITSYREAQAEGVAKMLRSLHAASEGPHRLVGDPECADVILVGGIGNALREPDYVNMLLEQETIDRYPCKSFTVSFRDAPLVVNRGVFESAARHWLVGGRSAGGAYRPNHFSRYVRACVGVPAPARREYLFAFIGRDSHPVRRELFSLRCVRADVLIEDSSHFSLWRTIDAQESDHHQRRYCEVLGQSKFALCPRGIGTGSIRLFEAMSMGISPVILADDWIAPRGPDWSTCSIRVPERYVTSIERIVESYESSFLEMGERARLAYLTHFADSTYFNYVVHACASMKAMQRIPESAYWRLRRELVPLLRPIRIRKKIGGVVYRLSRMTKR